MQAVPRLPCAATFDLQASLLAQLINTSRPSCLQELSPKQYWEELMAVVTYWMAQESAATTGTVSVLRQACHIRDFADLISDNMQCQTALLSSTSAVVTWRPHLFTAAGMLDA